MTFNNQSGILLVERVVKLLQVLQFVLQFLFWQNQCRYSEVMSAWSLLESTSRHQCNARVLQYFQTVEKIWCLSLSRLHCLAGKLYLWESVHGTLNLIAGNVLHSSQEFCHQTCSFLQWIKQSLVLSLVSNPGGFLDIYKWRVAHKVDHQLANRVWTKVNTFKFDELVGDLRVEVMNVHVPSSQSTLPQKSLWYWM